MLPMKRTYWRNLWGSAHLARMTKIQNEVRRLPKSTRRKLGLRMYWREAYGTYPVTVFMVEAR